MARQLRCCWRSPSFFERQVRLLAAQRCTMNRHTCASESRANNLWHANACHPPPYRAGLLVVYFIVIADLLAGHKGSGHPGMVCDLGGNFAGCDSRGWISAVVALVVLAPLVSGRWGRGDCGKDMGAQQCRV